MVQINSCTKVKAMGRRKKSVAQKAREAHLRYLSTRTLTTPMDEKKAVENKTAIEVKGRWKERRPILLCRLKTMIKRGLGKGHREFGQWVLYRIGYNESSFAGDNPRTFGTQGFRELAEKEKASDEELRQFVSRLSQVAWVTLSAPGVERKYTFGNKYIGHESQGEFVYLNLVQEQHSYLETRVGHLADLKEENYFILECKRDGKIWVTATDLQTFNPRTRISINGNEIGSFSNQINTSRRKADVQPTVRKMLSYGDIITISTDEGNENGLTDFVLVASNSRQRNGTEESSHGGCKNLERVIKNPLVLATILEFLSSQRLKKLRLVSQNWNSEALKILRGRVVVTVFHRCFIPYTDGLMAISNFTVSQLHEQRFPNWVLILPQDNGFFNNRPVHCTKVQRQRVTDRKVLDDLTRLMDPSVRPYVKYLRLGVRVDVVVQLRMLEVVFRGVATTLTTMDLEICGLKEAIQPSLPELKGLKSLSLAFAMDQSEISSPRLIFFLKTLLPAVRNIQTLRLTKLSYLALDEIGKMQNDDSSNFTNLTEINIVDCINMPFYLKALAALRKNSLTRLNIEDENKVVWRNEMGLLHVALERFGVSLQELSLDFNLPEGDGATSIFIFKFPERMPNLKMLSLFLGSKVKLSKQTIRCEFGIVEEVNEEGPLPPGIDYGRHFPSLSQLIVWPFSSFSRTCWIKGDKKTRWSTTWGSFLPALSAFMPRTAGSADHIETLQIPFHLNWKYYRFLDNLEASFPKVNFPPELDKARRCSHWNTNTDIN